MNKKPKKNMAKSPDRDSLRSKRRKNRGFTSFTESRKHKRADRRQAIKCTIAGKRYNPGEKIIDNSSGRAGSNEWLHTAGGSLNYHS